MGPGVKNLECPDKKFSCLLAIHVRQLWVKPCPLVMLRKGAQHCPALNVGLFLTRNKYLSCEFLFPREF